MIIRKPTKQTTKSIAYIRVSSQRQAVEEMMESAEDETIQYAEE